MNTSTSAITHRNSRSLSSTRCDMKESGSIMVDRWFALLRRRSPRRGIQARLSSGAGLSSPSSSCGSGSSGTGAFCAAFFGSRRFATARRRGARHQLNPGDRRHRGFHLLLDFGPGLLDFGFDEIDLRTDRLFDGARRVLHRGLQLAQFVEVDFTVDVRLDFGNVALHPAEQMADGFRHARQTLGPDYDQRNDPDDEDLGKTDVEHDSSQEAAVSG